jgi:hypothetical protein
MRVGHARDRRAAHRRELPTPFNERLPDYFMRAHESSFGSGPPAFPLSAALKYNTANQAPSQRFIFRPRVGRTKESPAKAQRR